MRGATHIDPALFVHHGVEIGALFRQESRVLEVALPVFDVELGVSHVQIAKNYDLRAVCSQSIHAGGHRV